MMQCSLLLVVELTVTTIFLLLLLPSYKKYKHCAKIVALAWSSLSDPPQTLVIRISFHLSDVSITPSLS